MGTQHEDGVVAHQRGDYGIALRLWQPLADQGDAEAQCSLGFLYSNGRGVAQDDAFAANWYQKAAYQGHAGAQFNLGCMYATGRGVTLDDCAAAYWLREAAKQDHTGAQDACDAIRWDRPK